jgi:hypothetical protein
MFCAALTSRSCRVPQDGHGHARVFKLKLARTYPHAEHVFDDGFQAARTQPNVRLSTLAYTWSGYARHLYAVLTNRNLIRLNSNT